MTLVAAILPRLRHGPREPPLPALTLWAVVDLDFPWWAWLLIAVGLFGVSLIFRHYVYTRFPLWIINHTFYRLHIHGREHLPRKGPALLVSNHVSWLDSLMIMAGVPRPVRFLIWAPFLDVPVLRWILRWG